MENLQADKQFIQEVLRVAEDDSSIRVTGIEISPCCKDGENYMALVSRVTVRGDRDPDRQEFTKSVVTKQQPTSLVRRELFRCGPLFRNETGVYSTVIPTFQRIFGDIVILPFPKCLHADHQIRNDLIILEDLRPGGFIMTNRKEGLDVDHCRLVLQGLAKYHAMSLALKLLNPKTFKKVRESIEEVIYAQEAAKLISACFENSLKMATESLRSVSHNDGSFDADIKKIDGFSGNVFRIMSELVKPKEPWSVICHGDCWNNNFLFRYSQARQVEEVRLLDLQVARYASPATDILHFLYTSTQADIRKRHYDQLLRIYHSTLNTTVRRLMVGSPYEKTEVFMPLKQLKDELEKHRLYGFLNALLLLPAVHADSSSVPDMETITEDAFYSQENLESLLSHQTPTYKESIRDLVQEYRAHGCL